MADIFDILAEKYDEWYDSPEGGPLYTSELACLKPMAENAPKPILEVGVGTGRFAMHFPDVVGIDPSMNVLKLAERRGVKTVHGYGEKLPFENATFGCILLIVTLCFVRNPLNVLLEAKRVLKENGSIIIGLVPKDSPWGRFYEKKKEVGHPFYSVARFYSIKDVRVLLKKADLSITRIRCTLLKSPDESREIEESIEGYVRNAGFLCIEVKKL